MAQEPHSLCLVINNLLPAALVLVRCDHYSRFVVPSEVRKPLPLLIIIQLFSSHSIFVFLTLVLYDTILCASRSTAATTRVG